MLRSFMFKKFAASFLAFWMFTAAISSLMAGDPINKKRDKVDKEASVESFDPVAGIWTQQFVYQGRWQSMLFAEVFTASNGDLAMPVLAQTEGDGLVNSAGITNVRRVNNIWTFDSEWPGMGKANFVLERKNDNEYHSVSYLDGASRGTSAWVRVATPVLLAQKVAGGQRLNIYESHDSYFISLIGGEAKESVDFRIQDNTVVLELASVDSKSVAPAVGAAKNCYWMIPKSQLSDVKGVTFTTATR